MPTTTLQDTATTIACQHCGEACEGKEAIEKDQRHFCCQGCLTVYELLEAHHLTGFYSLEEKAGMSLKGQDAANEYAFLDDATLRQQLIDFSDGQQTKIRFYLPQIHCTSCLWLLEKLPWLQEGVKEAQVNYLRKEVYITFEEEKISLQALASFLASLGYPPKISLEDGQSAKVKDRRFYYQLGLTGFCAGNIMLMSFPEYLGIGSTDGYYQQIFGYLNLLLSLPVLFYGGIDYLKSAYKTLQHKGLNIDVPIALGMLAIWLQSSYEILSQTGAGYFDSLAALVLLLLLGKWFQQRTFDHISFERDYKSYFPIAVTKINDEGTTQSIPLDKISKGDRIKIRNGELIPADAILEKGQAQIDYSFITGEAIPVEKQVGDLIYAGGRQQGGALELTLAKSVSQSYLTQLWNSDAFKKEGRNMQQITDKIGRRFTVAVLFIAFASAAYWWPISVSTAISSFTAVLIIACPCALALNVPFTLGNALRILAKKGFYVKETAVIERLARISHAVFDKTGTIAITGQMKFVGFPLTEEEKVLVKTLANHSTHPLSQQLGTSIEITSIICHEVADFEEVAGQGLKAWVGNNYVALGKASFVGTASKDTSFQTQVHIAIDGDYKGYFTAKQDLRAGAADGIGTWMETMPCSMLSGDHNGEREAMEVLFGKEADLLFEQSPEQKMEYIQQLQEQGSQVLMVGDGLNDAGALKQSDVGIAVSEEIHQFSPACDAILQADQLGQLPHFHDFSQKAMKVVYIGFILSLTYNLIGISYAVQGLLSPVVAAILMPLSSITVVGFGTLMTSWLGRKL